MEFIAAILGGTMLLALFALWWYVVSSAFIKEQLVVAETTVEEVEVLDDNLEPTGEKEEATVTSFVTDAYEAEAINYGRGVLLVGKVSVLAVSAAVWYFIFSPLFF